MSGTGHGTFFVFSSDDDWIDGTLTDRGWSGGTIEYGFPTSGGSYSGYGTNASFATFFSAVSTAQQTAIIAALDATLAPEAAAGFTLEGFTNLDVMLDSSPDSSPAQLRFANTSPSQVSTARVGDFPGNYVTSQSVDNGDVWFGGSGQDPEAGNYDWHTIIHEISHALGLKHGHDNSFYGALPYDLDMMEFTITTYRSYPGGPLTGYSNETWGYAQTWMMGDIAALQHMYGADYTSNSGDTVYSWDPESGTTEVDGEVAIDPGNNRIFATIWDGGGTDTYDLSAYENGVMVDLRPGYYSRFDSDQQAYLGWSGGAQYARGNIFNALLYQDDEASLIENATGGNGEDTLVGNQADNLLLGRVGSDSQAGGAGADTLNGGQDNDTLKGEKGADLLNGNRGDDTLFGGGGEDALFGHEDEDFVFGGAGNDTVSGGAGDDLVVGGGQDDSVYGDAGNDTLFGNAGEDAMLGGAGDDYMESHGDNDTLWGGKGEDTLKGGLGDDLIYGQAEDDSLAGGEGEDQLFGGSGDDTLNGLGGNDTLNGGNGEDVFIFSASEWGQDVVLTFDPSRHYAVSDQIQFASNSTEVKDFAAFLAASTQLGSSVLYDLGGDGINTITLQNTYLANLNEADFSFP